MLCQAVLLQLVSRNSGMKGGDCRVCDAISQDLSGLQACRDLAHIMRESEYHRQQGK